MRSGCYAVKNQFKCSLSIPDDRHLISGLDSLFLFVADETSMLAFLIYY
jgi:hypothetical protein